MPTIALDAMGGDYAPLELVKGAAAISLETQIDVILVGDEQQIQVALDRVQYRPERLQVRHTDQFIGMAEDPHAAVRSKPRASLLTAVQLVVNGDADAVVTAGNTGAAVLACARYFRPLPGIRRAALASVYPRQTEYPGQDQLALLLDVGATIRCEATELVHFAVMGSAYARRISKVPSPRVGLLNMGTEANKGGDILVEAYRRLGSMPGVNFVGNVEGHELIKGKADVIVTEGFTGNVVLKLLEGVADILSELVGAAARESWRYRFGLRVLESGVERLRSLTDYTAYGGAPILGFEHLLIKAHGRSEARAISNAIKVAAKAVRDGVVREIQASLESR